MRPISSKKVGKRSSFHFSDDSSTESSTETSKAPDPLMRILELDLLVLLTVGRYFKRLVKIIRPMLRVFSIASCAITLILTFLLIWSSLNRSSSRELAVGGQLQTSNDVMQKELERLRSKTLSLELAIWKMVTIVWSFIEI